MPEDEHRHSGAPLPPYEPGGVSMLYANLIDYTPVKWAILGLWTVLLAVSIPYALELFSKTTLSFNPPPGTWAEEQRDFFRQHYPAQVGGADFLVQVEWNDLSLNESILFLNAPLEEPVNVSDITYTHMGVQNFTRMLRVLTYQYWCGVNGSDLEHNISTGNLINCDHGRWGNRIAQMNGFWTLSDYTDYANFLLAASPKLNYRSTSIQILFSGENLGLPDMKSDFNDWMKEQLNIYNPIFLTPLGIQAEVFSLDGGISDIMDRVIEDLALTDGIAIPCSLIVAMIVLRNLRLMIWPVLCILVTTFASFALMDAVASEMDVNVIATPLMVTLIVGLPVHHAIFLLNRFREALLEGEECKHSVARMLSTAGTTVMFSQAILFTCCLTMLAVNVENVRAMSWSLAIPVFVAWFSAMTLGPALLLTFPEFFKRANQRTGIFGLGNRNTVALASQLKGRSSTFYSKHASVVPTYAPDLKGSLWHRFASVTQVITIQNFILMVLLVIITIPFAIALFGHTTATDGYDFYLPRGDKFTNVAHRIFEAYGPALPQPYKLMAMPRDGPMQISGAPDQTYDIVSLNLMDELERIPDFPIDGSTGAWYSLGKRDEEGNRWNSFENFRCLVGLSVGAPPHADCMWRLASMMSYSNNVRGQTSLSLESMWMMIILRHDPLSPRGRTFLDNLRTALDKFNNEQDRATMYLFGGSSNAWAGVERTDDSWSWLAGVFVVITFVMVLCATRSLLTAFRTVLTTFLTVCFALGFTVLTYCHGALDILGSGSLSKFKSGDSGAIHYLVPVVCVPLIIGLSVCHELFLVSAAMEWYHYHRLETKEATKSALVGTGWINCCSGIILAVSFMGLLFSKIALLNQISFCMFWAVLWDTLVMRTVLSPSLMAPFGKTNWWPATARKGNDFYAFSNPSYHHEDPEEQQQQRLASKSLVELASQENIKGDDI